MFWIKIHNKFEDKEYNILNEVENIKIEIKIISEALRKFIKYTWIADEKLINRLKNNLFKLLKMIEEIENSYQDVDVTNWQLKLVKLRLNLLKNSIQKQIEKIVLIEKNNEMNLKLLKLIS